MGAADIVPGVSGGTVALIVGIYERLVRSIRAGSSMIGRALRSDWPGSRRWFHEVEWGFLIPLVAGILLAILSLTRLLETLLRDYPEEMAGLFLGLIAGSVVIAWRLVGLWDTARLVTLASAALLVFWLLGLREGTSEETVGQLADPALWAFLAAGAVAVCALILPGVSGSFLLVVLGMYGPVLDAVNNREVLSLAVLLVGMVTGLALFAQLLNWSLQNHHDTVMAALVGLMVGSVRVLWPWPDGLDSTRLGAPGDDVVVTAVAALVALLAVVGLGRLGQKEEALVD